MNSLQNLPEILKKTLQYFTYNLGRHVALHCVETFLPDFIVILKRSLQNNYKIWKKCFFCTDSGEFVMKKLQDVVTKSLGSKG